MFKQEDNEQSEICLQVDLG